MSGVEHIRRRLSLLGPSALSGFDMRRLEAAERQEQQRSGRERDEQDQEYAAWLAASVIEECRAEIATESAVNKRAIAEINNELITARAALAGRDAKQSETIRQLEVAIAELRERALTSRMEALDECRAENAASKRAIAELNNEVRAALAQRDVQAGEAMRVLEAAIAELREKLTNARMEALDTLQSNLSAAVTLAVDTLKQGVAARAEISAAEAEKHTEIIDALKTRVADLTEELERSRAPRPAFKFAREV
jgi:hypothetical protein